ncbi:MAG: signal transduction histidine kinase regulating citrate/malate metabolism [Anaerocolumna sp.]|nr:signal transduction histidine kinase regulating citrate/malate metabolism [Anaerocolumna sp.]
MSIKKMVLTLLTINVLQFFVGLVIWVSIGFTVLSKGNIYIYLSVGLMLFSSLITIFGLYFASRYKNDNLEESINNLEELNTKLRSQRHDYLNHFQVIYGLMELNEYEEAKKYIEPVFKDIMKVSKALKTAQPAVNALLQAKIELAEKNNIDLFLEIRSELKNIPIEPWNLCKVLANIIDNSITALATKIKDKQINIEIGEDKINYTFLISNNGPKIPENQIDEIFKQGYSTKNEQGHGMGLFIVAKIIHEASGRISVESKDDKTSFIIELPKNFKLY